jgi:hypothetical protein
MVRCMGSCITILPIRADVDVDARSPLKPGRLVVGLFTHGRNRKCAVPQLGLPVFYMRLQYRSPTAPSVCDLDLHTFAPKLERLRP